MGLLVLLVVVSIFIMLHNVAEYMKVKRKLGKLTGKYRHTKTYKGNTLYVEVLKNNKKTFKEATKRDINILKQLKYLK